MDRRIAIKVTASSLMSPLLPGCASETLGPSSSKDALRKYYARHDWNENALDASSITTIALGFYKDVPFRGLASHQGDRLLFQWGTYNWGQGQSFEFDVTRQFELAAAAGDAAISQLRLTAHYQPSAAISALKEGNRWCDSRNELWSFEQFIRSSAAFAAVRGVAPVKVVIEWNPV
jgi:hypothetical protein